MKLIVVAMTLIPASVFAVDGTVLINQSTVMAAGGFPYTIAQSGSYKLSGKLTVPAGVNGIVIDASNVTLDLNGFSIETPPCSDFSCSFLQGISVPSPQKGIIVRNGAISGFPKAIGLDGAGNSLVEDLSMYSTGTQQGTPHFGPSNIIRHVTSNTTIQVNCPSVVAESLAAAYLTAGSTGCVFIGSSGGVF
jgi:hypothetical protein